MGWGGGSLLSGPRVIGGRGIVPRGAVGVVSAVRHPVYLVAVQMRMGVEGGMKMRGATERISSGFSWSAGRGLIHTRAVRKKFIRRQKLGPLTNQQLRNHNPFTCLLLGGTKRSSGSSRQPEESWHCRISHSRLRLISIVLPFEAQVCLPASVIPADSSQFCVDQRLLSR